MLPETFSLEDANKIRSQLISGYVNHFKSFGFKEESPLPITSNQDESVIFIGAAICGLKKDYIHPRSIPSKGIVIAQNCVRTRNIKRMLDPEFQPNWGSYFTNIDTISPYEKKEEVLKRTLDFFYEVAGIPKENLILRVNSQDRELYSLASSQVQEKQLETDQHPEIYYRHKIGIDEIKGKNFNFAIRHAQSGQYADVGNFIIFEDSSGKKFLEVGFGDTTILQLKYGLNHIMECYPFPKNRALNDDNKFKDCIITSLALMREGLEPSSKNEQSKILYKYLRALHHFMDKKEMRIEDISQVIYNSEKRIFGDINAHPKLLNIFKEKGKRIRELNNIALLQFSQSKGKCL